MHRIAVLLCLLSFASIQTVRAGDDPLEPVNSAILRADGPHARAALARADAEQPSVKTQARLACIRGRLDGLDVPTGLPAGSLGDRALAAYRAYWRAAINDPGAADRAEATLTATLRAALGRAGSTDADADGDALRARLSDEGLHSLTGRTGRLLELMLWRKQEVRMERVVLPDTTQSVPVHLLSDFVSPGWSRYFTCGAQGTGGWVNDKGLWAVTATQDLVASSYDLTSEDYRVSLLAHEAQHYADKAAMTLPDWRLEYRAKLVEIALADTTLDGLLASFRANQSDDDAEPHSFANRRLLVALREPLDAYASASGAADARRRLQDAAVQALRRDTADALASGAGRPRP